MVQAYALNMGLPELTLPTPPADAASSSAKASVEPESQGRPESRGTKRYRDVSEPSQEDSTSPKRITRNMERKTCLEEAVAESHDLIHADNYSPSLLFSESKGHRQVHVEDTITFVVQECLKASASSHVGSAQSNDYGHKVEVEVTLSNGSQRSKTVEWIIRPTVPEFVLRRFSYAMFKSTILTAIA